MDTQVRTPQAIFMQPQRLLVPLFQRPYVWNEEQQWEPLWRDLERVATRLLTQPEVPQQPHFLGAVVFQQILSQTSDLQQRTVIDGQQRLTTLQILLDALHAEIVQVGAAMAAARLEPLIENGAAFCKKPEDRFKVWPTNRDRPAFNEVMAAESPVNYQALTHHSSRLVKAHKFFSVQFREWLGREGADAAQPRAEALERGARELLQIVVIDLTANENAQEIFETLNARGAPLTAADLIKNFVFQRLLEQGADVEAAFSTYWRHFETAFWEQEVSAGRIKQPRSSLFLNHWLIARAGEEVVPREVFSRFKAYADFHTQQKMSDLLKDIHRAAAVYRAFTEAGEVLEGPVDRVALFAYRAKTLESEIVKPVLLVLLDRVAPHKTEEMSASLDVIESWLTRRMLVRLTTKSYNVIMADLVKALRQDDSNEPSRLIRDYLSRQNTETAYWPDDDELRRELKALAIYRKVSRSRLRMVLESIEDRYRGWADDEESASGVRIKRGTYAIEHVMPQAWTRHWALPAGAIEADREAAVHTLGNLTLLTKRLNSTVSNSAWRGKDGSDGKALHLLEKDVLLLNSRLLARAPDVWDEAGIEARTAEMIEAIIAVWPVPAGHKSVVRRDASPASTSSIDVADLLSAGLLSPNQTLYPQQARFAGKTGQILSDGRIDVDGKVFDTPSGAGAYLRKKSTNGWGFWLVDQSTRRSLRDVRAEYRRQLVMEGPDLDADGDEGD